MGQEFAEREAEGRRLRGLHGIAVWTCVIATALLPVAVIHGSPASAWIALTEFASATAACAFIAARAGRRSRRWALLGLLGLLGVFVASTLLRSRRADAPPAGA